MGSTNTLKNNSYDLVIMSCDANHVLWIPFVQQIRLYFPGFDRKIYLNTEGRNLAADRVPKCVILNSKTDGKALKWGERFIASVALCETKYVMVFLDDFILRSPVIEEAISQAVELLESNPNIICVNFGRNKYLQEKNEDLGMGFLRVPRFTKFRINLQPGLWRRDWLKSFIRPHEGPWQFETWGSLRSTRFSGIVANRSNLLPPVFDFFEGGVLADGKWRGFESKKFMANFLKEKELEERGVYEPGQVRGTQLYKRSFMKKLSDVILSL